MLTMKHVGSDLISDKPSSSPLPVDPGNSVLQEVSYRKRVMSFNTLLLCTSGFFTHLASSYASLKAHFKFLPREDFLSSSCFVPVHLLSWHLLQGMDTVLLLVCCSLP